MYYKLNYLLFFKAIIIFDKYIYYFKHYFTYLSFNCRRSKIITNLKLYRKINFEKNSKIYTAQNITGIHTKSFSYLCGKMRSRVVSGLAYVWAYRRILRRDSELDTELISPVDLNIWLVKPLWEYVCLCVWYEVSFSFPHVWTGLASFGDIGVEGKVYRISVP